MGQWRLARLENACANLKKNGTPRKRFLPFLTRQSPGNISRHHAPVFVRWGPYINSRREMLLASYLDLVSKQCNVARTFTKEEDQRNWWGIFSPLVRSVVDSDLQENTRDNLTSLNMVKITGLPYSTILDAAGSLADKLGVTSSFGFFSKTPKTMKLK